MTALENGLIELPAAELRPGDRVSFGDHTGWLKVRSVRISWGLLDDRVRIIAWPRRFKGRFEWAKCHIVSADQTAWIRTTLPEHITISDKFDRAAECGICNQGIWTDTRSELQSWIGQHAHVASADETAWVQR